MYRLEQHLCHGVIDAVHLTTSQRTCVCVCQRTAPCVREQSSSTSIHCWGNSDEMINAKSDRSLLPTSYLPK